MNGSETKEMLLLGLGFILLLGIWWSMRSPSPIVAVFGRWARWCFIALLAAIAANAMGVLYPFWILFLVFFLCWFLLETIYNWVAISALSKSELPIFPQFEENKRGDEWPSEDRFIHVREWLRRSGFRKVQAMVASVEGHVVMRVSVFDTSDHRIRIHVTFLPNRRGHIMTCFGIHSISTDGTRLVTDNIFLPFGGFYPDEWRVERRPWMRSHEKLLERHKARMDAHGTEFQPIEDEPLNLVNADQQQLESLNRKLGFLSAPEDREAEGRISPAGRYRVWQELWLLSYVGRSLKY